MASPFRVLVNLLLSTAIEIVGAVCVDAGGFFIGAKTFNDYGQTNSEGYPMKTRAAVAFEAKKPLEITLAAA